METDVLILIDSCSSGGTILSSQNSRSTGRTEIIAACSYGCQTPSPHGAPFEFTDALLKELEDRLRLNTQLPFTAASLHRGMSERLVEAGRLQQASSHASPAMEVVSQVPAGCRRYLSTLLPAMPVHFNICDDSSLPGIPLQPLFIDHDFGQNGDSDGTPKRSRTEKMTRVKPDISTNF